MPKNVEKLEKLKKHNFAVYRDEKAEMEPEEVNDTMREHLGDFAKQIIQTRTGEGRSEEQNERNVGRFARDISFATGLSRFYGIRAPQKDLYGNRLTRSQQERHVINEFLRSLDIEPEGSSLADIADNFGKASVSVSEIKETLMQVTTQNYSAMTTSNILTDWRFIISEIITSAIRLDYEASSLAPNWTASTVNITKRKLTMPHIKRGNVVPRELTEAESIPFGTLSFGQKEAKVFKVGQGFEITDELIYESNIDMIFEFLSEVGNEMSIAKDWVAMQTLLYGEQAGNAEAAPVVGVNNTTTGFTYEDIKRIIIHMQRLKRFPNRIISGEDDGVTISSLPKFEGYDGGNKLTTLRSILGVPEIMDHDYFVMPANQLMILDATKAMAQLKYRSLMVEDDRNAHNQTNRVFVVDHVGFAILRRDARVILSKALSYGSPDNQKFPAYMDIDARITQTFKSKTQP